MSHSSRVSEATTEAAGASADQDSVARAVAFANPAATPSVNKEASILYLNEASGLISYLVLVSNLKGFKATDHDKTGNPYPGALSYSAVSNMSGDLDASLSLENKKIVVNFLKNGESVAKASAETVDKPIQEGTSTPGTWGDIDTNQPITSTFGLAAAFQKRTPGDIVINRSTEHIYTLTLGKLRKKFTSAPGSGGSTYYGDFHYDDPHDLDGREFAHVSVNAQKRLEIVFTKKGSTTGTFISNLTVSGAYHEWDANGVWKDF